MTDGIHPDPSALHNLLVIFPAVVREDYRVELALAAAGSHGALWVTPHRVEIWLYACADVDERTAVLEAAHDALCDPAAWAQCWRQLDEEDGTAWLLWLEVQTVREAAWT